MARTTEKRDNLIKAINESGHKAEWADHKIVVSKDGTPVGKFAVKDAVAWASQNGVVSSVAAPEPTAEPSVESVQTAQ